MFRHELGVSDAVAQLIVFAIYSLIYSLLALLITCFMKMKAKDRLVIFITSFITMMDISFFNFSLSYGTYYIHKSLSYLSVLVVPVIIGGLVYSNILDYKKIKGVWLALFPSVILLALIIISLLMTILGRL